MINFLLIVSLTIICYSESRQLPSVKEIENTMNLIHRYQDHLTSLSDSMEDCDLKLTPRRIEYYEEVLPKLDEIKDY